MWTVVTFANEEELEAGLNAISGTIQFIVSKSNQYTVIYTA